MTQNKTFDIERFRKIINQQIEKTRAQLQKDKFIFEVNLSVATPKDYNEMARWMNEYIGNSGSKWDIIHYTARSVGFFFKCEEDAMAFKLRWS